MRDSQLQEDCDDVRRSGGSEYLPDRPIWLVFDLSNGHAPARRYVWWFDTKKDALDEIRFMQKHRKYHAPLSRPVRFFPAGMVDHRRP